VPELKINFKDRSTQLVDADAHAAEGTWVVFVKDGTQVLRVPGAAVESVSLASVPEHERPGPVVA
jgi:hypothetical protein